ncbi:fatty acid desaturase-domain-containing protein [Baffinella frigidus]|nr:fatty acid desaturase-domain-containing protein [Cryptophyta sp. CCMP2293]
MAIYRAAIAALAIASQLPEASAFLPGGSLPLRGRPQPLASRPAVRGGPALARMAISQDPKTDSEVRIDDVWYDLSRWRKAHPAGSHWIDLYRDQDATEVMQGFHSEKGMEMMKRLPKSKTIPEGVKDVSQVTRNFREWRKELVNDGWFEREWQHELFNVGSWATWIVAGLYIAQIDTIFAQFTAATILGIDTVFAQFTAATILGVANPLGAISNQIANTIGGWLSHDYVHGRGKFADVMRSFGFVCGGMSTTWWSDKHNKHHARTNEVGIDEDIATDPALFLWAPDPKNDAPWRKWQGHYLPFPMSLLFLIWRFDSIKVAIDRKIWPEVAGLAFHYAVMFYFVSLPTFFGAMLLSGFMTAIITTVTHQSEELFFNEEPEFVDAQYRSTRDAICSNPFSEWLWGGMQYQLEHHLFPTMPRYKYPAMVAHVKKFADDNNLE